MGAKVQGFGSEADGAAAAAATVHDDALSDREQADAQLDAVAQSLDKAARDAADRERRWGHLHGR